MIDAEGEARRARFVERGGAIPAEPEARALLDAICASGDFLPELLMADVAGFAALAADPYLRREKPGEPDRARGAGGGRAGQRLRRPAAPAAALSPQ